MFKPRNFTSINEEQLIFFGIKRAIFFANGEAAKERPAEKPAGPGEKYLNQQEKEGKIGEGVDYKTDIHETLQDLSSKAYKKDSERQKDYQKELFNTLAEEVPKKCKMPLEVFWGGIGKTEKHPPCGQVTIENKVFVFKDVDGKTMDLPQLSAVGIPIDAEEEVEKKDAAMRMIDEEAEAAEQAKLDAEAKGKEVRKRVFGNPNKMSGSAKFKNFQEYMGTKISDIYADAQNGDRVEIRHMGDEEPITVEYRDGKWVYKDSRRSAKKVTITYNDGLVFIPAAGREIGAEPPNAIKEGGFATLGYFRMKKTAPWAEIARTIMTTGTVPKGDVYGANETPSTSPASGSPQEVFKKLGYDPNNEQDVKNYVDKILKPLNAKDKLYVWIVVPKQPNQRQAKEAEKETGKKLKKEAEKTTSDQGLERLGKEYPVYQKHHRKLYSNEDYDVKPQLVKIIEDDELWNYYFTKGHLKESQDIFRGFQMLGVGREKVRDVISDAITQGDNEYIDFEDLLDAFNHKKVSVFKNVDGEPASYDDFKEEYDFLWTADRIEKGLPVSEKWREVYEDGKEDYLKKYDKKNIDVKNRFEELKNILRGSAMIMEGLGKITPGIAVEAAELRIKQKAEEREEEEERKKETGKKYVEKTPTKNTPEEIFLQYFFHPQRAKSLSDITETEELDESKSDFENRFSDATAYDQIRFKAASKEDPTKIDRGQLIAELNALVSAALDKFKTQYLLVKDNPQLLSQLDKTRERYFGTLGYEAIGVEKPDFKKQASERYGVPKDLNLTKMSAEKVEQLRNLFQDGYILQRERAVAKGGAVETTDVPKEWKSYSKTISEALEKTENPATREVAVKLMENEKFRNLSPEEQEKIIKEVDQFIGKAKFEQSELFQVNAAVDVTGRSFWAGLSKEILNIPEIDLSMRVGIAINPINREVLLGMVVGKNFELADQWKANIMAGAGVEVTNPRIMAGVSGGFTWMSKGSPDTPWRTKINFGAGAGVSLSFNARDVYGGPFLYFEAGQTKDWENQKKQLYTETYLRNRLDTVDQAKDIAEKAAVIRRLPRGLGEFMQEMQYNMKWRDDEQLVDFYEREVKKGLDDLVFNYVYQEEISGVSEWGVGVSIDPVALLMKILTLGAFVRLGFVVDKTIKVERKLTNPSPQQIALDNKMIADFEKAYPGVKIEITGEKYTDMDRVMSAEFAGDDLERIIGVPKSVRPTRVEYKELTPSETPEFKQLKKEFAENRLQLSIDPETKMYAIKPAMTEACSFYLDRKTEKGNGLILKGNTVLVPSGENLSGLHIKRFDLFYPGEVNGAVQHTIMTFSNNPYRKMGVIAEDKADIEITYDREANRSTWTKTGSKPNVLTYEEFKRLPGAKQAEFLTSESRTQAIVERRQQAEKRKENLGLTRRALDIAKKIQLEESIDLSNLPVQPTAFIKKYPLIYRKLSTSAGFRGPTLENLKELDRLIEKENPGITPDQRMLYKEMLFHKSMSEHPASVEARLKWAEGIFKEYFEGEFKKLDPPAPDYITPQVLTRAFLGGVRQHLKDTPVSLAGGESIFTAVGTLAHLDPAFEGIRSIYASTGQNPEENKFRPAFDYAEYLSASGTALDEEQRYVARILTQTFSELPKEDERFVHSRIAKKLFYLGSEEVPNPLTEIMGREKFEKLITVYDAVEKGEAIPAGTSDAIKELRNICEQLRDTQLGNGIPTTVDGRDGYAVLIGNYYFVIQTKLMSGYYEQCKNPSPLYNEAISVFDRGTFESAPVAPKAVIAGTAADVVALESRSAKVTTLGIGVVGIGSVALESRPDEKTIIERIPAKPKVGAAPEVSVDQPGPGTNAETDIKNE